MGDRDVVAYERFPGDGSRSEPFGDEVLVAWRMVIEGKIRAFPETYHDLEYARGYDAYVHWREMYEDAHGVDVRRATLEQIALETEFFDAALVGVDFIPGALEDAERKDLSLRAFLRCGGGAWRYRRLNSRFKGYDPEPTPVRLWYVRDNRGHSNSLLPRLYRKALELGIGSFFWITAFGPVCRVDAIEPLPEDIATREALAILEKRGHYRAIACGGTMRHPKKLPKNIDEFVLGNQFAHDKRPEIHGIAENHARLLRDQRLDRMDWREIELNEANRR